jgi:cobalt-precorrin-5B (C1)-methyltransferase
LLLQRLKSISLAYIANTIMARTGYTLPVFAVAAAQAALLHLLDRLPTPPQVVLDLLPDRATIPIQQVAKLEAASALAIALSDPGDNLDLTRHTPIWAKVELVERGTEPLSLRGGEGLGQDAAGNPAIYRYAQKLFAANLLPLITSEQSAIVTIILPAGKQLAQRTSNAAFGIVDGLSLLGTSGISQPLSTEEHLAHLRQDLQAKAQKTRQLVFCIGSNGMQVADRLGIPRHQIVQTGNWIGALLLEAGLHGVESVLLLGYQGKLIKLAGGIFNTSSHLADAKLEIIGSAVVCTGGDLTTVQKVLDAKTADAAYQILWALGDDQAVFGYLATQISTKAQAYVQKYADVSLSVDIVLFDRQGKIITGHLR